MRALPVLLLVLVAPLVLAEQRPLVQLTAGTVRGTTHHSLGGRAFSAFRGIPYAEAPVGDLRFEPPQPHPGWSGVREAADHGASCLQYNMVRNMTQEGEEDCLFVNVYTPQLPKAGCAGGLPVMVYIHGGGFQSGDGNSDLVGPHFLLDEEVVLVTLNYRLGVFGFFTTEDAEAPGNMGLRDQQLALRWVKDNIAAFGGDPELVTVFGESAGGASVSLQVISPLSAGLFHRAISQSGAAASVWGAGSPQRPVVERIARDLNCPTSDSGAVVACLRRIPALDLLHAMGLPINFNEVFHPRVDADATEPVLPEQPNRLLQRGAFNRVPWMMGTAAHEGYAILGFMRPDLLKRLASRELEAWSSAEVMGGGGIEGRTDRPQEVAAQIRDFYLRAGGDPTVGLEQMYSDRWFVTSVAAEAELGSQYVPVYKYLLDHAGAGQRRFGDMLGMPMPPNMPPTHGDDLPYLFSDDRQPLPEPGSPDHTMIRLLVSLWTSFARRGYPATEVLGAPDWPVFTAATKRHLRLNSAPSVDSHLFQERLDFWRALPLREPWNAQEWEDEESTHDEL